MHNIIAIIMLIATIALSGCAATTGGGTTKSPEQLVFQLKSNYNVALTVAVAYKNLPACEAPNAPVICHKATVVRELQRADNLAFPLLQAAENVVRNPCPVTPNPTLNAAPCDPGSRMQLALNSANQAITAFTSITATLATK